MDFEDVLEAVERLVGLHETAYLLLSVLQPQTLDVDLALGKADVKVKVLLKGMFELG